MEATMESAARLLILFGLVLILVGGGLLLASRLSLPFLGRLPGDIIISRDGFTFYFPIVTSILLSLLLTLILNLVFRIGR
jgi:hypothetical protein